MRTQIISLLTLLFFSSCVVTGCTTATPPIKEEVIDVFVVITDETVAAIETDLEWIDSDLYNNEAKLLKLERVVAPVLEWAESQKEDLQFGSYVRRIDPEWLKDTLTSDQYQVNEAVLTATNVGSPSEKIYLDIKILDVTNNAIYSWDSLDSELKAIKSDLIRNKQELVEIGKQAVITLQKVIDYMDSWEVVEIDKNTYNISGPGLGIPGEGTWIYYRDTGQIVPDDKYSNTLQQVLSGER